jgi:hypothetical protein
MQEPVQVFDAPATAAWVANMPALPVRLIEPFVTRARQELAAYHQTGGAAHLGEAGVHLAEAHSRVGMVLGPIQAQPLVQVDLAGVPGGERAAVEGALASYRAWYQLSDEVPFATVPDDPPAAAVAVEGCLQHAQEALRQLQRLETAHARLAP